MIDCYIIWLLSSVVIVCSHLPFVIRLVISLAPHSCFAFCSPPTFITHHYRQVAIQKEALPDQSPPVLSEWLVSTHGGVSGDRMNHRRWEVWYQLWF